MIGEAMRGDPLTQLAHIIVAVACVTAVTVMAIVHVVSGDQALLVVFGVAGITGPALGRPQSQNGDGKPSSDHA